MKPVLISGAGLGGLLLARSLRSHRIPFEIFERDSNIASRGQGYRIRISEDGLTALESVLAPADFGAFLRGTSKTGQGGMHGLDAISGEPSGKQDEPLNQNTDPKPKLGEGVIGVSRVFLRSELLRGFEEKVQWGKRTIGYERGDEGVRLLFKDGTKSTEGCMLVAADSLSSSIAKQLTDGKVRAYDTGARMIHGQTRSLAFKELGEGVYTVSDTESQPGSRLGLVTNVRPGSFEDKELELGWVLVGSPGSFEPPNGDFELRGKVAADISRTLTAKWHPKFRVLFDQQNDAEAVFLKMSTAAPEGVPDWETGPRVTLLGDAVHCMTPAGGVGANTALKDAALLGRLLGERGGWYEGLTKTYEDEMRVYASANVKMSFESSANRFNITELK